jgi:hypothetical protein
MMEWLKVKALSSSPNTTKKSTLLMDETTQIRKVVLQNNMALDFLTASQGEACALLHSKCYVYIPDNQEDVTKALKKWIKK